MNKPTQISIAMATYNGEKFIKEQLESILKQTVTLHEIIITDDNSQDSTRRILTDYRDAYPELIKLFFNEKNLGYIKNFEKAVSLCSGEYIALSDQDDLWDANKIEVLLDKIQNADLAYSDARLIDGLNKILHPSFTGFSNKQVQNTGFINLCINNTVTGCTILVRKNILSKAIPFPTVIPHDHWLALVASDGNGIKYYDHPLISYRQHDNNALGAKSSKKVPKSLQIPNERDKKAIYQSRANRYEVLLAFSENKFQNKNRRKLTGLFEYYTSFFAKKIRIKSFFFHLFNIRSLSYRKSVIQIIYGLFFTLAGEL